MRGSDLPDKGIGDEALLYAFRRIAGKRHVLTSEAATYRYRRGFRFGEGPVLAVVRPGSLVEMWRVAQACVRANKIVIMQAANTGLTGGSVPDGADYDRDIVIISTLRMKTVHLIGAGRQVVCLPGATLNALEERLEPLGREPHSVIGSSCLGASVLGGISNNSGGALVRRGVAYTEMALFGQVNAEGHLSLVNHLGIHLPGDPETILHAVEAGGFAEQDIDWAAGQGHDADYVRRVQDVEADTPARFNADPGRWHDAAGCAGKLLVFAVRLDTFEAEVAPSVFYVGTNSTSRLEDLRRALLTEFDELPIAGEYVHRDAFDLAHRYGKDTLALIRWIGTRRLPLFFSLKSRIDIVAARYRFLPKHLSDRAMQLVSHLIPEQLPQRLHEFRDRFEHHLMIKVSASAAARTEAYLAGFFSTENGDFFNCTPEEGKRAFLHRFAVAGAAVRYRAVHSAECSDIVALDIALRRNDREWFEVLPKQIEEKVSAKIYYGHFFCHVMHQDYVVKTGYDAHVVEQEMLPHLDRRGARYPAEHNFGHLYKAPGDMISHYKALDPCNCFNPGIGQTSRKKKWLAESV